MLKMDAAKWTAAVSDSTVDDQISKHLLNSSTHDDNQKSRDSQELEALRQIYEQICALRDNHAQIVAENTAKRAEVLFPSIYVYPLFHANRYDVLFFCSVLNFSYSVIY